MPKISFKFLEDVKNSVYTLGIGVVKGISSVLTIPYLIHSLGLERYGLWVLGNSIIDVFSIAELGLSSATVVLLSKSLSKKDNIDFSRTLSSILIIISIISIFSLVLVWCISDLKLIPLKISSASDKILLSKMLKIGSCIVAFQLLQQVINSVVQSYQRYKFVAILDGLQFFFVSLGWILISNSSHDITFLAMWQLIVNLVVLIIYAFYASSIIKDLFTGFNWSSKKSVEIARFSLINWIATVGIFLSRRGDRFIVSSILGLNALGIYSVITEVCAVITSLATRSIQPVIPSISFIIACEQDKKALKIVKSGFQTHSTVIVLLSTCLLLCTRPILSLFLSSVHSTQYLFEFKISVIITALCSSGTVGYYVLMSLERPDIIAKIQVLSAILSLTMIIYLSYGLGLRGAILGNIGWLITSYLSYVSGKLFGITVFELLKWIRYQLILFLCISTIGIFYLD